MWSQSPTKCSYGRGLEIANPPTLPVSPTSGSGTTSVCMCAGAISHFTYETVFSGSFVSFHGGCAYARRYTFTIPGRSASVASRATRNTSYTRPQ